MEALWLKSQGLPHQQITRLTGISLNTFRVYLRQYQTGGLSALKQLNYHPQESELLAHRTTIEDYFRTNPPTTIKEAAAKIYELTGIQRSESRVRALLKRIDIERRKVGHIPAQAGQRSLFFVDAAHFVLAPFLGVVWSLTRLFIKAPAGRKRFNSPGRLKCHDP